VILETIEHLANVSNSKFALPKPKINKIIVTRTTFHVVH
jgi:hypothetical protein